MEYYLLKLYQEAKKRCPEVEQGFYRFSPKMRKIAIACLTIMFASIVEIIVATIGFENVQCAMVGAIICLVILPVLLYIDNSDERKHLDKYTKTHKKKLYILDKVLSDEFNIKSKDKIEELVIFYQECIDKWKEEQKRRNAMIIKAFTVFAGVLTWSFENMGVIGIDYIDWINWAIILIVFAAAMGLAVYVDTTYLNPLKKDYEIMIKELLVIKY